MPLCILRTLFAGALLCLASEPCSAQWSQRGGPLGNHQIQKSPPPDAPLFAEWTIPLMASDSETIFDGQSVFVTALDYTETGVDAHRVASYSAKDGSLQWERVLPEASFLSQDISDAYPVRPLATPTCIGNRLIVVGFGGSVHCLDKSDGSILWKKDLIRQYQAEPIQFGAATSPWSDGQQVLVACGGSRSLVVSFRLDDGSLLWESGKGSASYVSFVPFETDEGELQIVYGSQDALFAFNPTNGSICWSLDYPKPGLTNAVTPLAVAKGKLLVGGQGWGGTQLIQVRRLQESFDVKTVWSLAKPQPFYCNWVQDQSHPHLAVGFAGQTLYVLDWNEGKLLSQSRGWTDCNLVALPQSLLAIRGDGFLGELIWSEGKLNMNRGQWIAKDRIWSPPVVDGHRVFLRGRKALYHRDLRQITAHSDVPPGTDVSSMEAMYGGLPEKMVELLQKAKKEPTTFSWTDYQQVAEDPSTRFTDANYRDLLDVLEQNARGDLALRIAEDWGLRQPASIAAHERRTKLLRQNGQNQKADELDRARLISVEFLVKVPSGMADDERVFLAGNSRELGDWKPDAFALTRIQDGLWSGKTQIPKGDLQFKLTKGTRETYEKREDGRPISNRRLRLQKAQIISLEVSSW